MENRIAEFLLAAQPSRTGGTAAVLASGNLFNDGWLDSLLQLRLLNFLEKEFSVYIPPFRATVKNFETVSAIAALVASTQGSGAQG